MQTLRLLLLAFALVLGACGTDEAVDPAPDAGMPAEQTEGNGEGEMADDAEDTDSDETDSDDGMSDDEEGSEEGEAEGDESAAPAESDPLARTEHLASDPEQVAFDAGQPQLVEFYADW